MFTAENADMAQIAKTNGNRCRIQPTNTDIGVIRMPNLGVDLYKVYKAFVRKNKPGLVEAIQRLPLIDLLKKGVRPLFHTVQALRNNRRLHRDIKMENIMIQPSTGEMHIIDYDLEGPDKSITGLKLKDGHLMNYPPESVLWKDGNIYEESYDAWVNQQRTIEDIFIVDGRHLHDPTVQGILKSIITTDDYNLPILNKYGIVVDRAKFMYKSIDTLDSYCTAASLLPFFFVYMNCDNWPNYTAPLSVLFADILIPMSHFDIEGRMTIDDALDRLNKLINSMDRKNIVPSTPHKPRNSNIPDAPRKPYPTRSRWRIQGGGTRKKLKSSRRTKRVRRRA